MDHLLLAITISLLYMLNNASIYTKNKFNYTSNQTYWQSLSKFTPIRNESYGTIKLGRRVRMEFKFIYHSRSPEYNSSNPYENAFRIGYGHETNTAEGTGARYPSMWIFYKGGEPHVEFSISDSKQTWRQYPPLNNNKFSINKQQIYECVIEFNETYVSIFLSDHKPWNVPRVYGTAQDILDDNLNIWIAQWGHGNNPSAVANITLFDIIIQTFDHYITASPTNNPTKSPIESIVSIQPIELYEFYNEPLDEYKNNTQLYQSFIYNAIIMTLQNITGYSMNMADHDRYFNKSWDFGGIYNKDGKGMEFCMIFNEKLIVEFHRDCPFIPHPHSNDFDYVSVGLLYVESNVNSDAYREYIMDIMGLDEFHNLFRKHLSEFVNDDQQLFIIHSDGNGYINNDMMNKIETIGIIVIITCFTLCMMMIGYYSRKWYKIMDRDSVEGMDENGENEMCRGREEREKNNDKVSIISKVDSDRTQSIMSTGSDENILKIYRKVTVSRRKTGVKLKVNEMKYKDSNS